MRMVQACWLGLASLLLGSCEVENDRAGLDVDWGSLPPTETIYVSPEGGGSRSGESARDALAFDSLQQALDSTKGDLAIFLAAGEYEMARTIVIERRDAWTRVRGEGAKTVLFGRYRPGDKGRGRQAFSIRSDRVEIARVSFRNLGSCVSTRPKKSVRQVRLLQLRAAEMHSCVVVGLRQEAAIEDWLIHDLQVHGYYQAAIRLSGRKTANIRISSARLDGANRTDRNDCFKGGVQLLKGVSKVDISDVQIRNNVGDCGKRYQQGDGIEVDNKGGAPTHVRIRDASIEVSGDAGLDLKGRDVVLTNVRVKRGSRQGFGFRFWSYDDYRCVECRSDGGRIAHLDLINAGVLFRDSAFEGAIQKHGLCRISDKKKGRPSQALFENSVRGRKPIGDEPGCVGRAGTQG